MAAATRQDDQGNVVQVGEEGEGEHQDTEGWGPGNERDEVPPIPMNLEALLMEEHIDTIPWIPYHPTLWIF